MNIRNNKQNNRQNNRQNNIVDDNSVLRNPVYDINYTNESFMQNIEHSNSETDL